MGAPFCSFLETGNEIGIAALIRISCNNFDFGTSGDVRERGMGLMLLQHDDHELRPAVGCALTRSAMQPSSQARVFSRWCVRCVNA